MPRCSRATCPISLRDRVHVQLSRWHWTSNVIVGARRCSAYGGLPYVLWGIFFRTTVGLHATWLVNSATHKWGSRRFDDARRLDEQLVGGAADVRRRVAQQPSRASDERAARSGLVRGRLQLVGHPRSSVRRPRVEHPASAVREALAHHPVARATGHPEDQQDDQHQAEQSVPGTGDRVSRRLCRSSSRRRRRRAGWA